MLVPHVEHMDTFLEMLSTVMRRVRFCFTFSCVCVMDGLLTDSSDANIGLSACVVSGHGKLNLSALLPPLLINFHTLDCVCSTNLNYILFIPLAEQVGVQFALTF